MSDTMHSGKDKATSRFGLINGVLVHFKYSKQNFCNRKSEKIYCLKVDILGKVMLIMLFIYHIARSLLQSLHMENRCKI